MYNFVKENRYLPKLLNLTSTFYKKTRITCYSNLPLSVLFVFIHVVYFFIVDQ